MTASANTQRTPAREIFAAAVKLEGGPARQQLIELACRGDDGLLDQVQALLAADTQSGNALNDVAAQLVNPAPGPATTETFITDSSDGVEETGPPLDVSKHPKIGPYTIRELIGEGGMGYVYVAEQAKPVRRKVALKVIKPGMDTREVIARFEAERQALAMMSHPNIAKVLDGGATDQGRPYFVMELVRGEPITKFCDQQQLATRERLELFLKVCQAVQHAHMKGIIHRDLKPSNVIVEVDDVRPIPKVIDFGVAKATGQQLSQQTVYTQFSQLIGTPLYMSPEQAKQSSLDIDTRSDIYSLGVTLYELLTGTTPFDKEALSSVNITELQRIICEDDPPRPSLRVSTLKNEQLTTISSSRKTEGRKLQLSMQRELDWIVMKAMEKDRTRRYESASAFAADIQRYLDDEPVLACPPSAGYRLRKFTGRHRIALSTTGLVVLSVLAGFATTVWQLMAVDEQRVRAIAAEQRAEEEAARARAEADRAEREAKASIAVNTFLNEDLLAQARPENQPDPDVKLRTVVDRAATEVEHRFADQPVVEAWIRQTLADTYGALGDYLSAKHHADRALSLRTAHLGFDSVYALNSARTSAWMLAQQGDLQGSRLRLEELYARVQSVLGEEHSLTLRIGQQLGGVLAQLARFDEADALLREVIGTQRRILGPEHAETMGSLGFQASLYGMLGRNEEAADLFQEVLTIQRRTLGEDHPATLQNMGNLAGVFMNLGRHDMAEELLLHVEQTQQETLGVEHPSTLRSRIKLASLYSRQGRIAAAEPLLLDTIDAQRRVLGDEHPDVLSSQHNLAHIYFGCGRSDDARQMLRDVLSARRRISQGEHPDTLKCMTGLANIHIVEGRPEAAEELMENVLGIQRRTLGQNSPHVVDSLNTLAIVYAEQGRHDEAEEVIRTVLETRNHTLGEEHPATLGTKHNLAYLYLVQQRFGEAEELFLEVIPVLERVLGRDHPKTISSTYNLAQIYLDTDRPDRAEPLYRRLLESSRRVYGDEHFETAAGMNDLGISVYRQGRYSEAEQLYRGAYEVNQRVLGPAHADTLMCMRNLANAVYQQQRLDEVADLLRGYIRLGEPVLGADHEKILQARDDLAVTCREQGLVAEWTRVLRENLEIKRRVLGEDDPETQETLRELEAALTEDGAQNGDASQSELPPAPPQASANDE